MTLKNFFEPVRCQGIQQKSVRIDFIEGLFVIYTIAPAVVRRRRQSQADERMPPRSFFSAKLRKSALDFYHSSPAGDE
jgi:hypothetical protein